MKRAIFEFLQGDVRIKLKVIPRKCGWTNRVDEIVLNPKYDILSTCLHEVIHCLRGDLVEAEVLKEERRIAELMTNREWKRLLTIINLKVNHPIRGGY